MPARRRKADPADRRREVSPSRRRRQGADPAGGAFCRPAEGAPPHRLPARLRHVDGPGLLHWGCDVWLNNPLRPLEVCGTSGMKSALNGGLNLSIRDGWWTNGTMAKTVGPYRLPTAWPTTVATTWGVQRTHNLLEQAVAPKFYERDEHGVPPRWIEMVRHTLQTLGPRRWLPAWCGITSSSTTRRRRSRCARPRRRATRLPASSARLCGCLPQARRGGMAQDHHHRRRHHRACWSIRRRAQADLTATVHGGCARRGHGPGGGRQGRCQRCAA